MSDLAAMVPISRARVLLVDDDEHFLEVAAEYLRAKGFEVIAAKSASEAEEVFLRDESVGVVVTDLRMPGRSGLRLLADLRESGPGQRDYEAIVITASNEKDDAIAALRLGVVEFLSKPVAGRPLLRAIEQSLGRRKARETRNARIEALAARGESSGPGSSFHSTGTFAGTEGTGQRTRADILGVFSHEFRTPLHQLAGISSLLRETALGGDDVVDSLDIIDEAVGRLEFLVDSILDYASIQAGDAPVRIGAVYLDDITAALSALFGNRVAANRQAMEFDVPTDLPALEADRAGLLKVLGLLLDNASRFSPDGTSLQLRARAVPDGISLEVRDDGPGMTEEELERAMEPFRQVDEGVARRHDGLGIGLPLAHGLVVSMGGSFQVDSGPGEGTTVSMVLPVDQSRGNR